MKFAEARYTGRGRSTHRKAPSGTEYMLRTYPGGGDDREWVPVESTDDAEWLAEQSNVEVRWNPLGRLKAASDDAVAAVKDLGYDAKRSLVGEDGFDLDVPGNAPEDEMDEAITDHVRELQEQGEL